MNPRLGDDEEHAIWITRDVFMDLVALTNETDLTMSEVISRYLHAGTVVDLPRHRLITVIDEDGDPKSPEPC